VNKPAPLQSLDDFLLLLKGVKAMPNGQFMALCPGHNDKQRSLSVTEADGRILPHCFAGCQLPEILKPLGLQSQDLFLNGNHNAGSGNRVIETTYDYTDTSRKLLFQVVRYRPKHFTQRRPDGKGDWIWNLGKVKRVLYHLPEVIQAVHDGQTIFIAEGEKDVDNLRKLGLSATCNPMGAGKWQTSYSENFKGANVVIIADKDAPGRNHAQQVARSLTGKAATIKLLELPGEQVKDASDWIAADGTREKLEHLATEAPELEPATELDLPQVIVTDRHLRDATHEALAALHTGNNPPHIFLRGGKMVRIIADEDDKPVISILAESELRYELANIANFMRLTSKGLPVPTAPPINIAENIMAEPDSGFPPLLNITETPVIRSDGTILLGVGYDSMSKLYYFPSSGLSVPPIPDKPTQEDIQQGVGVLDDVIHDFPFDGLASYANAMAMIISPAARPMITGCVPLGVITKPQVGTGASLLAETIAMINTGRSAAMMSAPRDDEAWRKGLTGLLLRGQAVAVIDNVEGTLYSAALASLLTADTFQDRILGSNEMIILPNKLTMIATGNNIRLGGDLPRRCVVSRIDSLEARPWLRDSSKFRHPFLKEWVLTNRGKILAAILTLIRAWVLAGRPSAPDAPNLGGYESWVRVVGGTLYYAGVRGFLGNLDYVYDTADTETPQWDSFLTAWHDRVGEKAITASELAKQLEENNEFYDSLPDTLADARKESKGFTRRIGNALAARAGRRYPGGLQLLRSEKTRDRAVLWQVRMSLGIVNSSTLASTMSPDEFHSNPNSNENKKDFNNNSICNRGSNKLTETHLEAKKDEFSPQNSFPPIGQDNSPPYPTCRCPACGSTDYWLRKGNKWGPSEWLCNRCHPGPEKEQD
jgi:5S rRNA maturation endonuclease (ribonuclease M5)